MTTGLEAAEILRAWNGLEASAAMEAILPCNGSPTWASAMVSARPFSTGQNLLQASDRVWLQLAESDWDEAFASHPRLGSDRAETATRQSLAWSAGEQRAVGDDASGQAALREANRVYEATFGRIFLVCATGRSAAEILAILKGRLGNDARTELLEAVEQQRRITQLRLRKWLRLPPASCDDV